MNLRKLLFVLFILCSSPCWGQSKIAFKGIRLGISEESFVRQLKSKGFVYNGFGSYEGPFFSGDEFVFPASVTIHSTPYHNKVYDIDVSIPSVHEKYFFYWKSEDGFFKKFADLFIEKYGPTKLFYDGYEVPLSSIDPVDKEKGGIYSLKWENGKTLIVLSFHVVPEYSRRYYEKKLLGFIPNGGETYDVYKETHYSISISYKDRSVYSSKSIGSVGDL